MLASIALSRYSDGLSLWTLNSIGTSVGLYVVYLVAGAGYVRDEILAHRFLKLLFVSSTIAIVVTQLLFSDVWLTLNESGAYLRIADLYCLMTLLIISRMQGTAIRAATVLVAAPALLFLGSRSSLLFFGVALAAVAGWKIIRLKFNKRLTLTMIGLAVMALVAVAVDPSLLDLLWRTFSETRIGQTLETEGNGGLDTRGDYFRAGLERIVDNPLFGNWQYRLFLSDTGGDYIHNVLFLWDDYGFFVFFLMVLLLFFILIKIGRRGELNHHLASLLFCIFSMVFARAYAFPYFFFFVGIVLVNNDLQKRGSR